jgi:hypothetical protein
MERITINKKKTHHAYSTDMKNQYGTCGCHDWLVCIHVTTCNRMEEQGVPLYEFTFLFSNNYRIRSSLFKSSRISIIRNPTKAKIKILYHLINKIKWSCSDGSNDFFLQQSLGLPKTNHKFNLIHIMQAYGSTN